MKINVQTINSLLILILFAGFVMMQTGCRKTISGENPAVPKKFTELKVAPNFEFENFITLEVNIGVSNTGIQSLQVIQIFEANPANNGKRIASGATDANQQYKTTLRVPSRLKELYVGKISASGTSYVAVPITGTNFQYEFGKPGGTKSADASPDCSEGCTATKVGTVSNLIINAGEMICVAAGTSATFKNLTLNSGGTIKVCGNVTFFGIVKGSGGTVIISPGGTLYPSSDYDNDGRVLDNFSTTLTYTNGKVRGTINNYGTITFTGDWVGAVDVLGTLNNYNTGSVNGYINVEGTFLNQGPFTVQGRVVIGGQGKITNECSIILTGSSEFTQNHELINNGYIKVPLEFKTAGGATTTMGSGSLIECKKFSIEGNLFGPSGASQPKAQIKAINTYYESKTSSGCVITNYIDLCAPAGISPKSGSIAPTVTYCAVTVPVPSCGTPTPPEITSASTAGGTVGQPFSYIITATGTPIITYNATGLPGGLLFNGSTISGSPAAAGTFNVALTADNNWGTGSKILVITVASPGSPPVITSPVTASCTANQPFSYTISASGTAPITYATSSLPAGLTRSGAVFSGSPTTPGTYNISISATNAVGSDNKTLALTVNIPLVPPAITSPITASGTTGVQFSYVISATGTSPVTFEATGIPVGLSFNGTSIQGVPTEAGTFNVTLSAQNDAGTDSKVLAISIIQAETPPVITSLLNVIGIASQQFSYNITATGTAPVSYTASPLPSGLTYLDGVISGIPNATGTTQVSLHASNNAGTDDKILVITINQPSAADSDGDGVADDNDAYPLDATRAFNSYYPNEVDFGTFVYEDLWPSYGDYDCNDLVMNFQYKIVTNAENKVVDLVSQFKIKAVGATFNNGFGFSLSTLPANIESVTGCIKLGTAVEIDPKGYEAGHADQTVVIPVDAVNTLLGSGIVNTVRDGYTVETSIQTVTVHLSAPQASIGEAPFNPFIFSNQNRAKEVHMKDQPSTGKVDPGYFGTFDDASNPAQNFYYRSSAGLTWAMEIPVDFDYPVEKADIVETYLHFAEWAQSSGTLFPDWYMDKPGYRNQANIY